MSRFPIVFAVSIGASASACDTNFDQRFEQSFEVALELPPSCEGSKTLSREGSSTTINLRAKDEHCHISFEWDGALLDGEELRAQVEEKAGKSIKGLKVKRFVGDIASMALFDAADAAVESPHLIAWGFDIDVNDSEFLSLSVTDATAFLTDPVAFRASSELMSAINSALSNRTDVDASGSGRMVVPLADFERMKAYPGLELRGVLNGDLTVEVDIGL